MSKKLHILFLASWFPSRVDKTNGDFVQRHAEAVATKHDVSVIFVVTDEKLQSKTEIKISTKNNVKIIIAFIPKYSNPISKLYYFLNAYKSCFQEVKEYNIVHLNITSLKGLVALFLKWFKNKPFIISEHWTRYLYPNNLTFNFFEKFISKLIIKEASFVCPVSKNLKENMIEFGLKGNYIIVPNVVDTTIFNISNNKTNSFTISHISHMGNEHKNVIGILNTIKKLQDVIPNFTFNLIGNNSTDYNVRIKDLDLEKINLIDQIEYFEVAEYLKSSNLLVLFSNYENLPCIILESFSCGVPVISTDVGGISEFFPENFGYLIKLKDELALKEGILKIYNSELKNNPEEMHKYVESIFSFEKISQKFSEIYCEVLDC